MKNTVDKIAIEFCSTVLSVGEGLTPENLLYWARNKEKLEEILKVENFEPITQLATGFEIPELPQTTRGILWRKRIMETYYADDFTKIIDSKQASTDPAIVTSYQLNVDLFEEEICKELEISDIDELAPVAFTFSQIAWLVARHRYKNTNKPTVLKHDHLNYIPLLKSDGGVIFVCLYTKRDSSIKSRNWKGWFVNQKGKYFHNEATLLLQETKHSVMR